MRRGGWGGWRVRDVEGGYFGAGGEEGVYYLGADEAGAAGYEDVCVFEAQGDVHGGSLVETQWGCCLDYVI